VSHELVKALPVIVPAATDNAASMPATWVAQSSSLAREPVPRWARPGRRPKSCGS
jgi:hypothetical protein